MTRPETLGPGVSYRGNRNPSFSLHQLHCLDRPEARPGLIQVQHITNCYATAAEATQIMTNP